MTTNFFNSNFCCKLLCYVLQLLSFYPHVTYLVSHILPLYVWEQCEFPNELFLSFLQLSFI